jgi:hypothetical protein
VTGRPLRDFPEDRSGVPEMDIEESKARCAEQTFE